MDITVVFASKLCAAATALYIWINYMGAAIT